MCGIAGFFTQQLISESVTNQMMQGIISRGPDAQNTQYWASPHSTLISQGSAALIHSRLSIRDLSSLANQPMSNTDQSIWLCYNGEIYDWESDAEQLKQQGFSFKTSSDTEYILNAYQAYGLDGMLSKLRGMFAFALMDFKQQKLYLVRDRFGIKPLVYYFDEKRKSLAFGSTVRSVLPFLPNEQREFSSQAIDAYLAHRYIPAPSTIFSHINRLENAHYLCCDLNNYQLKKVNYWQPKASQEDWKEVLSKAIHIRTVADRPVGVFLSGGVDSSTIAAKLAEDKAQSIDCFTASFPNSHFDESEEAISFAKELELNSKAIPVPQTIQADFSKIIQDLDEPFADPSSFPTWYLAQETVKDVTVVLGGDGGDELFAGYKRHAKHNRVKRQRYFPWLTKFIYKQNWYLKGWRKILIELSHDWVSAYALRFSGMHWSQRSFLQPEFKCKQHYWRLPEQQPSKDIKCLLEVDRLNYLPEYILRKADLCTMAHGLEQRVPLLDHHFYQAILALPDEERFTNPAKQVLQQSTNKIKAIFSRKKRGFNPPLKQWLHHELNEKRNQLGERLSYLTSQQIDAASCNQMVEAYYAGHEELAEQILQLYILDESLEQLEQLRQDTQHG